MIQLAKSPLYETSNPPIILTSICFPLIIAKDYEELKNEAFFLTVIVYFPALTRSGST